MERNNHSGFGKRKCPIFCTPPSLCLCFSPPTHLHQVTFLRNHPVLSQKWQGHKFPDSSLKWNSNVIGNHYFQRSVIQQLIRCKWAIKGTRTSAEVMHTTLCAKFRVSFSWNKKIIFKIYNNSYNLFITEKRNWISKP